MVYISEAMDAKDERDSLRPASDDTESQRYVQHIDRAFDGRLDCSRSGPQYRPASPRDGPVLDSDASDALLRDVLGHEGERGRRYRA